MFSNLGIEFFINLISKIVSICGAFLVISVLGYLLTSKNQEAQVIYAICAIFNSLALLLGTISLKYLGKSIEKE